MEFPENGFGTRPDLPKASLAPRSGLGQNLFPDKDFPVRGTESHGNFSATDVNPNGISDQGKFPPFISKDLGSLIDFN
jgi:hypothetical protein